MSRAYYNEFDPKAALWLRELIKRGLIADGEVDTRSIADVRATDLHGFTQCHFFAGIGGWSHALRLAGWKDDRPVWTGSCPCQPFSCAGKGLAQSDVRHLWPVFANLIRECRPVRVFGEQVANAIGAGWLDGVRADMEAEGYVVGAAVLGAHSVGAPHIRQRLYWVADAAGGQRKQRIRTQGDLLQRPSDDGANSRLADTTSGGWRIGGRASRETGHADQCVEVDEREREQPLCQSRRLVFSERTRLEGYARHEHDRDESRRVSQESNRPTSASGAISAWSDFDIIHCLDGKTRRIPAESAFFPLADGIPARVVRLRGYGNAIVPQVAQEFIEACEEALK